MSNRTGNGPNNFTCIVQAPIIKLYILLQRKIQVILYNECNVAKVGEKETPQRHDATLYPSACRTPDKYR
jgi:hypothetical protein